MSCRISKNNIGEYYLTITLQDVNRRFKVADDRQPIGIDVNVSEETGVVSSRNKFYKNKKFKKNSRDLEGELHRRMSRRYGVSNEKFREECKAVRRSNKNKAYEERTPLPSPSKRYQKADLALKKLSLKTQRQRDYYQHEISATEVGASSIVGIESLNVSGMMKNDNLSYSLADAAMSSQLNKISYKCKWANVPVMQVGQWFPSSHKCPDCGHLFDGDEKFGLAVREWTCPDCGSTWNRDLAAAENIKQEALQMQAHPEFYVEEPKTEKKKSKVKSDRVLDKEHPDILIRYDSKMKEDYKNPWIVVDLNGNILDDAQGYGFDTAQKAQKCYKYKLKQQKIA